MSKPRDITQWVLGPFGPTTSWKSVVEWLTDEGNA